MAKVKEIFVSFGRKVSRDYQSINFDAGETVIIEDGDDPQKIYEDTFKRVKSFVITKVKEALQPPEEKK